MVSICRQRLPSAAHVGQSCLIKADAFQGSWRFVYPNDQMRWSFVSDKTLVLECDGGAVDDDDCCHDWLVEVRCYPALEVQRGCIQHALDDAALMARNFAVCSLVAQGKFNVNAHMVHRVT